MKLLNSLELRLVLTLFCVFSGLCAQPVCGETLIYSNSRTTPLYYPAGSNIEVVDYGTSSGGNVTRFTFGYGTERPSPGTLTIWFYDGVDRFTSPGDATPLKGFSISNLPGPGIYYRDYVIPAQDQFTLASGNFGYSYEFTIPETGPAMASGGAGNEDYFWEWAEIFPHGWDWYRFYFENTHSGFYMEVYTGPVVPEQDPTLCYIEGYKFDDADGDGVWDQSEQGLANWEIFLDINNNGQYDVQEPNVITDPNGFYEFLALDPDTYTVAEVMQPGWTQTLPRGDGTYVIVGEPNQVYSGNNFGNTTATPAVTISGYARTSGGVAIPGVLMSTTSGQSDTTNASGYYEVTFSSNPWTGTITPAKTLWSFSPPDRNYDGVISDILIQNFTGTYIADATPTISGYVRTGTGVAVEGVLMFADTGEIGLTNSNGYYAITVSTPGPIPSPWTGSITPTKDSWSFSPPYHNYSGISSDWSNRNFTGTYSMSIQATEDAYIDSANPDTNYGSTSYLNAGSDGSSDFRAFLKFDLSSIPPGNIITSATLRLHNSYISSPEPELNVYRVYDRWEESTVTWNDQPGVVPSLVITLPNTGSINGSITTWDVTKDVDSEYIGDAIYSIMIAIPNENRVELANFSSMDSSNPSFAPELVLEYKQIFGGGSGEVDSPYQIWTGEQFNTIGLHPNRWTKNYELMANISMAAYTGNSYNLIGTSVASSTNDGEFKGVFDGKYHAIKDFSTNESVFGYLKGATIKALKLISPDISSGSYTGAIAGHIEGGNILDCQVQDGTVDGSNYVGGLVGRCSGANIINCSSSASVSGYDYVGGFIGGPGSFGGVGSVSNCYATGSVQGSHYVGGFIGRSSDSPITNCYSAGLVTGTTNVGAFSGYNSNQYTLESTIYNCFYDSDVNPTLPAIGNVTGPFGVTGESTENLQIETTFTNAGWDFVGETANGGSDNWAMLPAGYPVLWYELLVTPALPPFAGGTGTTVDPYLIETEVQLNSIGYNSRLIDKHFKLINDLDMDGMKYYMIAPEPYEFSGTFDGNGHTVSNILIEPLFDSSSFGFIAILRGSEASINDLTLVDPVINSDWGWRVGSLVGENEGGTITNCHAVNADVRAMASVGGLVGVNYQYSRISGCSATGKVSDDTIMSGFSIVGGLVGENTYWSEIENSFAICSVNGEKSVGGLVGINVIYSLITNCYAGGDVIGTNNDIGGLVGRIGGSSEIAYCYSSSVVIAPAETESVGGLVGDQISTADNYYTACFWDSEINPGLTGIGDMVDPDGMTGESTANMQTESTFTDAGWDFTTPVWKILEGIDYPKLNWDNSISAAFSLDHTWMYQNLPGGQTGSNLTADISIVDDPSSNSSYTYQWEIILPSDVTIEPSTVSGGDSGDQFWTFAAPSCNEPTGISDSGQTFTVKVTVIGDNFGNVGSAQMEFAIALLGDVNNSGVVNVSDLIVINGFWRNGSAEAFTLRDCDVNCDDVINVADRIITNAIRRGVLGSDSITPPCPLR